LWWQDSLVLECFKEASFTCPASVQLILLVAYSGSPIHIRNEIIICLFHGSPPWRCIPSLKLRTLAKLRTAPLLISLSVKKNHRILTAPCISGADVPAGRTGFYIYEYASWNEEFHADTVMYQTGSCFDVSFSESGHRFLISIRISNCLDSRMSNVEGAPPPYCVSRVALLVCQLATGIATMHASELLSIRTVNSDDTNTSSILSSLPIRKMT